MKAYLRGPATDPQRERKRICLVCYDLQDRREKPVCLECGAPYAERPPTPRAHEIAEGMLGGGSR